MSTFVLVHGGWAGGWVWEKVVPALHVGRHRVIAPDLPGHGADRTPSKAINLDSYVDRVIESIDREPERVVLVGHSSGGVIVTQAAEHRPDAISLLVYLAAFVPQDGQSVFDLVQADPDQLVGPNLVPSPDGTTARIRHDVLREALFADCSQEDFAEAAARFVDEPMAPAATPVKVTADGFGRVPRSYIECLRDRGLSLAMQRAMHTAARCRQVVSMDTGHMPQYAAPGALAQHLAALDRG